MPKSRESLGFGFNPKESPYHFAVVIPEHGLGPVAVEERLEWFGAGDDRGPGKRAPRASLPLDRWTAIAEAARVEFNRRLREAKLPTFTWLARGDTLLSPAFGKELILLCWAVEEPSKPEDFVNIVSNWLGLAPEERWWLYTTINATSGHPAHGPDKGWRRAVKVAFAENPANVRTSHAVAPTDLPDLPLRPELVRAGRNSRSKKSAAGVAQLSLSEDILR